MDWRGIAAFVGLDQDVVLEVDWSAWIWWLHTEVSMGITIGITVGIAMGIAMGATYEG